MTLLATARTAVLAIRDERRRPGNGWALSSPWATPAELAERMDCCTATAMTALRKLQDEDLVELDCGGSDLPVRFRSREV